MKHDDAPVVRFAEVVDDEEMYGSEEAEDEFQEEDSLMQEMPVKRKRKLPEPEKAQLTRYFALNKEMPPLHTGGKLQIGADQETVFSMNENRVSIFSLSTGDLITTLYEEEEEILTFAVCQNLKYIATTNKTYMIRVYNLQQVLSGQKQSIQQFRSTNQMAIEAEFDPSGRFLAIGTSDSVVKVYDVQKGYQTHNFTGHSRGVICKLAFHPGLDQLRLASAGEDYVVRLWDLVLNKEIAALKGNRSRVTSIQFTNDGKTMVCAGRDGKIALYNCTNFFKTIAVLQVEDLWKEEDDEVTCLQYIWVNSNKSLLVIGGAKGTLAVLDLSSLNIIYKERDVQESELTLISYLPATNSLLTCNMDQNLAIYRIHNLEHEKQFELEKYQNRCLYLDEVIDLKIFKPQNEYALLCSNSETLKLLHLKTGICECYNGHTDIILCLDICVNKETPSQGYCLTGAKDNTIRMWSFDLEQDFGQKLKCLASFLGHSQNITSIYFAPKKALWFCSVSQDNTLKVWKNQTGTKFSEITSAEMTVMAHQKYINCVRVSPNDKVIATSSQDKHIKLWDSNNLHHRGSLVGHRKGVWDIQFNPSEQILVSAAGDNDIRVWNLTTNQCAACLQGHKTALVKAVWLNAGLQIASASVDGIVKVWNVSKQSCLNSFEMHEERIWALDFAENFEESEKEEKSTLMMVTGGSDSKVKIWKDNTIEQELHQKETKLNLLQDEQNLSKLMRENDLPKAALLAFKLNKLRDFFHIMNRIVSGQKLPPRAFIPGLMIPGVATSQQVFDKSKDPIDSILLSKESFQQTLDTNQPQINIDKGIKDMRKVVGLLLKESGIVELLELTKKLNARQEYARLAQIFICELLQRQDIEELASTLKQQNKTQQYRDLMQACEVYGLKHYARADRGLKQSFYLNHVVGQITLQADVTELDLQAEKPTSVKKRDKKAKSKTNLF